jgi:hypothetical protein
VRSIATLQRVLLGDIITQQIQDDLQHARTQGYEAGMQAALQPGAQASSCHAHYNCGHPR